MQFGQRELLEVSEMRIFFAFGGTLEAKASV